MITELHDVHVSRELALLLKQAGFDWKCRGYFDDTGFHDGSVEYTNYDSDTCKYLKAPTFEVAQRWLREVKNLYITIFPVNKVQFTYIITKSGEEFYCDDYILSYNSYEKAQEEGINDAIKLILLKGK